MLKSAMLLLMTFLVSCSGFELDFWSGDSDEQAIYSLKRDQFIQCNDVKFNEYHCLHVDEIKRLRDKLKSCVRP
jgi:hypothetical protein